MYMKDKEIIKVLIESYNFLPIPLCNNVDFLREYKEDISWNDPSMYFKFDTDTIEEFKDYIDWDYLIENEHVSFDLFKKYYKKISIEQLTMLTLPLDFIDENIDYLVSDNKSIINLLCYQDNFKEEQIDKYFNKMGDMSKYRFEKTKYSECFYNKYKDLVMWY